MFQTLGGVLLAPRTADYPVPKGPTQNYKQNKQVKYISKFKALIISHGVTKQSPLHGEESQEKINLS